MLAFKMKFQMMVKTSILAKSPSDIIENSTSEMENLFTCWFMGKPVDQVSCSYLIH